MPAPKLQRWIDLLAALLRRTQTVPFEQLVEEVPGYLNAPSLVARRRTFERDKDELRAFGIPIETTRDSSDNVTGYLLRRASFYLPYLSLLHQGRSSKPRRIDRYGYQTLPELSFEPEQLESVVQAARRVSRLGDVGLADLATSAVRKLAFDLPVDAGLSSPRSDGIPEPSGAPVDSALLEVLDEALRAKKVVTVEYHAIGADARTTRELAPYGLFFLGHHWYLAAADGPAGPVKNFRVSRMQSVRMNELKPGTPDYEIPSAFRLRAHARSRQAWELGDSEVSEAIVELRGASGPVVAARRLGTAVEGSPTHRRFAIRRHETFARWLLSFGGEIVPVSPPALVDTYLALARATRRLYLEAR
ncbi:MAG: WYL domain-containing protein [Gemmatimonadota bacterium]